MEQLVQTELEMNLQPSAVLVVTLTGCTSISMFMRSQGGTSPLAAKQQTLGCSGLKKKKIIPTQLKVGREVT